MPNITQADRARLQAYLRRALHSPGLMVEPPETQRGTAQVRFGNSVLGTVDQVDEDGERSWAVTLIVLGEDLEGQVGQSHNATGVRCPISTLFSRRSVLTPPSSSPYGIHGVPAAT